MTGRERKNSLLAWGPTADQTRRGKSEGQVKEVVR